MHHWPNIVSLIMDNRQAMQALNPACVFLACP